MVNPFEAHVSQRSPRQDMEVIAVRLIFMGELKRWAGRDKIHAELPLGSTVDTLAQKLGELCGEGFARRALTRDGAFQPHIAVFVNGVQMGRLDGTRSRLTGGEVELMLLPVYEGG